MRVSFTILKPVCLKNWGPPTIYKSNPGSQCKKIYSLKQMGLKKKRKHNFKDNKLLFLQIPSFIDYCT